MPASWLAEGVLYLNRADWGADPTLPRLGGPEDPRGSWGLVPRAARIYPLIHHTVIVDSDITRNVWETLEEVKLQMRRLQVIRPDLGLDVPYNFVLFLMAGGTICVCEGRGYDRWGAHTAGQDAQGRWYNGAGIATAWQGNFEDFPLPLDAQGAAVVNRWNAHLGEMFSSMREPFLGHRDTGAQTACPGRWLYEALPRFSLKPPLPLAALEDGMPVIITSGIGNWISSGLARRWIKSPKEREELARVFGISKEPQHVSAETLERMVIVGEAPP